jgi:hypothetical protein
MAGRKQSRRDGASSLSNLKVTKRYLDPAYEMEVHDLTRGNTGLLKVFSLTPQNVQRPRFMARIDDGNPGRRRSPELDIDIDDVSSNIKSDFNAKRNGYAGHHTDRSPNQNERIYDVKIVVPTGTVFDGEVSFNVQFTMVAETGIYQTLGLGMNVIRASAESPIPTPPPTQTETPNWLERVWARIRGLF